MAGSVYGIAGGGNLPSASVVDVGQTSGFRID